MEKRQTIIEPNFEGEEMHLPEAKVSQSTEADSNPRLLTAPIIVLLFLILVAILAGFYYWYTIVMSEQVVPETATRPTALENNEPESTTAEARTSLMDVVSTSDELDAIAADAQSTNLEDLVNETTAIEAELDAAIEAGQ
jgi:flagellar basal body-associated protein FliL